MTIHNRLSFTADGRVDAVTGGTAVGRLNQMGFDAAEKLCVADGGAVAVAASGLPFTAAGDLVVDSAASPTHWHDGIPFSSAGRICVEDAAPVRFASGMWPITAGGKVAMTGLAAVPINTLPPVVSGTTTEGQNLSSTTGTWTNSPTGYAYQWQRSADGVSGWSNIGTNSNSYTLQAGDVGNYVRCVVTASNLDGAGAPAASNVVGPVAAAPASLLLDNLANKPVRAYALRRVLTAYTGPLIRVRRSSDNAQLDIGYDGSNELDVTALLAHCGAGNGFVVTWYDQMGNGNLGQGTTGAQPQIVTGGALTATANSRPLWRQSTAQDLYVTVNTTTTFGLSYSARWVSTASGRMLTDDGGSSMCFGWQSSQYMRAYLGAAMNYAGASQDTSMHVMSMRATGGTLNQGYLDGSSKSIDNAGAVSAWSGLCTNGTPSGTPLQADYGELYLWGASANADLQAVDADCKTRFGI